MESLLDILCPVGYIIVIMESKLSISGAFKILTYGRSGTDRNMKRTSMATALRIHCVERTCAMQPMQLACMCALCASSACTVLFMGICVREDMEVQV